MDRRNTLTLQAGVDAGIADVYILLKPVVGWYSSLHFYSTVVFAPAAVRSWPVVDVCDASLRFGKAWMTFSSKHSIGPRMQEAKSPYLEGRQYSDGDTGLHVA